METDLTTLRLAICPRVFPDVAPLSTARPYITYQQIGGQSLRFVEGTAADKRHHRMQINVWASRRTAAIDMAHAIEDAMCLTTAFVSRPDGELIATAEEDMGLYGTIQTFDIWSTR